MKEQSILLAIALTAAGAWAQASAPVIVTAAWARASVPGQRATGAFMTLTAAEPLTLVGVASPAAGVADVHEMKLDGDVMRMRAVPALELPAHRPVELKPGGYHVMLQELKGPLASDTSIPMTLTFRTARGEQRQLVLKVPVSATPPKELGAASAHGDHKH